MKDVSANFAGKLTTAANATLNLSSGQGEHQPSKPWWIVNYVCAVAFLWWTRQWLPRTHILQDLYWYCQLSAMAKHTSWRTLYTSLTPTCAPFRVWAVFCAVEGRRPSGSFSILDNGSFVCLVFLNLAFSLLITIGHFLTTLPTCRKRSSLLKLKLVFLLLVLG